MPVITQMFPYLVTPEIQLEIDKQLHSFEVAYNWLENVKETLLRGEDDDQVFLIPKTPAYQRRKRELMIKSIPEEADSDADNTFDVSSSSMQSSVSSVVSEVSVKRSHRTAAVKANLQMKTQVNANLSAKLRQPSAERDECSVQSNVVTHSSDNLPPPNKKIRLECNSIVSGTDVSCAGENPANETTELDNSDIILSEIFSKPSVKEASSILPNGTAYSPPASASLKVIPDSERLGEEFLKPERGPDGARKKRNVKSVRSTRSHSRAIKERRKRTQTLEEISKRPSSKCKELESNDLADKKIGNLLCVDVMAKNVCEDPVSEVLDHVPNLTNDPKLKLKAVVSVPHINLSDSIPSLSLHVSRMCTGKSNESLALANEGDDMRTSSKEKELDILTDFNDLATKENATTNLNVPVLKPTVVTDVAVTLTERNAAVVSQDDLIQLESPAEMNHDDMAKLNDKMTEFDVVVSPQNEKVATKDVAVPQRVPPAASVCDSSAAEKLRESCDQLVSPFKNAQNGKPTPEIIKITNSGTVAVYVAPENPHSIYKQKMHVDVGSDTDQDDASINSGNTTATKHKTGNERKSLRSCLKNTKDNADNDSQSLLETTFNNSSGKKSPAVALADISNTMNTSVSLRDTFLKDFKKTPHVLGSPHFVSTPLCGSFGNSLNWNCRVVLSNPNMDTASRKQWEKSHKTPTSHSTVIFSPYAKESVKNRVAKFENLNALVEVNDENSDPDVQPQSGRVTRTKTRAMAAAAAAKNADSNTSVCKNYSAVQTTARKSLKKAVRISGTKSKRGLLTPNTSRDETKLMNILASSMKKYNIVGNLETFIPRANKVPNTAELEKKKEEEQRRQKERAEEACRKKEILLNAKAMEKKKKNDEKSQKVTEKREAQQREEQERRLRLEREKEEKMMRLIHLRDEKLREEQMAKRVQLQQKLQEVEERRRQDEAVRLARIREQEEQEARRKEQLEKERLAEENAAAREQALLQKQKGNNTVHISQANSSRQEAGPMNQTYNVEEEEDCTSYKISDVGANSDDDLAIKHALPKWAKSYQTVANHVSLFDMCIYLPEELRYGLYGEHKEPDLTSLLGLTAQQVAHYRRQSSMFPPRDK